MTSLCLSMIVKDNASSIGQCLDSVRPFISSWVIADVGSTDGTQGVVRERLAGVPGQLHERPFQDWARNRNDALALAAGKAEYLLLMDAEDVLEPDPGFRVPTLEADEIQLRATSGDVSVFRTHLVRSALPWRYVGVAYEVIGCSLAHSTARLAGLTVRQVAGRTDAERRRRLLEDVELLEAGLQAEPGNMRYAFYLAESYRGLQDVERAIAAYERRVGMGGWQEETWHSLYQIAQLREQAGHDQAVVVEAYLRAYDHRPQRAEPLCELARYYRERTAHAVAHLFASRAVAISRPDDSLFVQESTYEWRSLDEYAVSAFYVGKVQESLACTQRLLRSGKLPMSERPRVEGNLALCLTRTGQSVRKERNKKKRERRGK